MSASPALQSWQAAFDAQSSIDAGKRRAFAAFLAKGLPTTKIDAWKYTDLRRLTIKQFRAAAGGKLNADVEKLLLPLKDAQRFVFVDGVLHPASTASQSDPTTDAEAGAFSLLNAALSNSGFQIDIAAGTTLAQPIYIAHVWTDATNGAMTHPRVTLKLGRNGKAAIVEHYIGANSEANFTNSVLDIQVDEHATLEHIRIQDDGANYNIGAVRSTVAQGASYASHHHVLGGGLTRADFDIRLTGRDARAELHGLVFARETQHLDVRTCIEHRVADTRSREDYRGIADQRGRVIFNGKVIVAKDAQRTDAAQSSRNLLLSPHAEIDTRPELEIYADDVKCAHGATVGQLDATSLFYLRSRGITEHEARTLLTHAFAAEVIERIPVPQVRDYVLARFMSRMMKS